MDLELKKSGDEAEPPERAARPVLPPSTAPCGTDLYSPAVWGPRCPAGLELLRLGLALLQRRGSQPVLRGGPLGTRDGAGLRGKT